MMMVTPQSFLPYGLAREDCSRGLFLSFYLDQMLIEVIWHCHAVHCFSDRQEHILHDLHFNLLGYR